MNKIARFTAGSSDTALSAERMNEIVDAINAFLDMRGQGGIKVSIADGNVVIDGSDIESTPGDPTETPPPVNDTGTLTWGGDWENIEYEIDTLVIRQTDADIADGNLAATYVSIAAVPVDTAPPGTEGAEGFWAVAARGNWNRLVFREELRRIDINATGSDPDFLPEVNLEEDKDSEDGAKCRIQLADLAGKHARFVEVTVCIAGVEKHMLVLGTEPY
jgi:hypothetical protein